ncbi:PREDICTED: transmembrane protein 26 isoform X2 [Nicrophorus vespilloides]|uniref:Transmembrane protein 26 isoform X2 n=1 Tax=Nicrophorus vespilloides TaxID=110193 RepID=A0ABM1M2C0_NICVS|nr:PREDICTED: transmembrane protein 26 isoform X2 [Nicrophorus vespilloides]
MAKLVATIKAIITRLVFAAHGFLAIWQVTIFKSNSFYWYLSSPILLLFFEAVFTLTIKENQEWKWFCPSVFLYLASIVPAIWLLELDKVDRRLRIKEETFNITSTGNLKELNNLIGVEIKLPDISLSTETWITLIEQFLMLILIIGRWMLPKGDLTRDQLSQLLLVYIGTAADIIEFFDSFKDDKIAAEPILVLLTLAIWSWSLMQFTVVLTATKARKSRLSATKTASKNATSCCCSIDVWGIALNITLQDAPFLVFRLLIITHFNIISYMNVFFTCKNTLVILLQLYRLYVVYSENHKPKKKKSKDFELTNISIISKPALFDEDTYRKRDRSRRKPEKRYIEESESNESDSDAYSVERKTTKKGKKDTGYSTASSHASNKLNHKVRKMQIAKEKPSCKRSEKRVAKKKLKRTDTKEIRESTESSEEDTKQRIQKSKLSTTISVSDSSSE